MVWKGNMEWVSELEEGGRDCVLQWLTREVGEVRGESNVV